MKVLITGKKESMTPVIERLKRLNDNTLSIKLCPPDPLTILSDVLRIRPTLLVLDDNNLQEHSTRLLQKIREVHPDMKIIFLTDNPDVQYGKSVASIGVDFYAIKPISEDNILEAICSIAHLAE